MPISGKYIVIAGFCLFASISSCKKEQHSVRKPIADAGPSQTITLPTSSASLIGNGIDPDRGLYYSWKQISGPTESTIMEPRMPSTVVRELVQGSYSYQLSVFDDLGNTGMDTTVVTVNP